MESFGKTAVFPGGYGRIGEIPHGRICIMAATFPRLYFRLIELLKLKISLILGEFVWYFVSYCHFSVQWSSNSSSSQAFIPPIVFIILRWL